LLLIATPVVYSLLDDLGFAIYKVEAARRGELSKEPFAV
jgi:hypothetical protein